MKRPLKMPVVWSAIVLALIFVPGAWAYGQRESAVSRPHERPFKGNFLNQLQRIFGRFRNEDLRRIFDKAKPVPCSDLVSGDGKWREVAFFNEYRPFGDWHRRSLDAVKRDLAAYIFHGVCTGTESAIEVTTQFPVQQSLKAYEDGKIRVREDIDINVNAPVNARFDSQTGAYIFDLPYLFRISGNDAAPLYTLNARTPSDRYAPDVTNRWECKSVADDEVTYQFLICHTRLVFREAGVTTAASAPLGTSAFSILSDGKEALSSVKLTFGDDHP